MACSQKSPSVILCQAKCMGCIWWKERIARTANWQVFFWFPNNSTTLFYYLCGYFNAIYNTYLRLNNVYNFYSSSMTPEMNSMAVSCYTRFSPSSLYTMQVYRDRRNMVTYLRGERVCNGMLTKVAECDSLPGEVHGVYLVEGKDCQNRQLTSFFLIA